MENDRDTPDSDQLSRIEKALTNLDTPLQGVVDELRRVDSRSQSARQAAIVGIVGMCVGLAVAIGALWYGLDARATAQDIIAARSEARIGACESANLQLAGTREAIAGVFLVFAHPDASGALPQPEQDLFDTIRTRVDSLLPDRDCSPAGIAAFYDHPASESHG